MNAENRERARTAFAARALELDALLELLGAFVHSSLGRRAVRELAPLEESEARDALERVREMQLLERAKDLPSLGGLTDPGPILEASAKRGLEESELAAAVGFLAAVERLGDWLERRIGDVPSLGALGGELPDLTALRERLARVVDERGKIMSNATPLLAKLRDEERALSSKIDGTLRQIAGRSDVRNSLTDGRVHLRGGRHCLAVRAKSSGRIKGIIHDRSQSEQSVFVEPREVIPLANRLVEVRLEERRELSRILSELSHEISANAETLELAGRLLGKLEMALVSIGFAAAFDARVPKLSGDKGSPVGMVLRQARHPLLISEVLVGRLERVVPVDLRLGDEFSMLIITGPNTGGKTLALKTAGLFALMVRLGLPVPCSEGSAIPFYDGIAADIGDEQEISQSLSTFSSHLVRIRDGLARATPKVLMLLDELGGGTDPDEGAALGEALLERLLEMDVPTLVSTHLGRLKEFAFRHPRVENACAEFDLETLAPCYTLVIGVPGESAALVIARRYGLDDKLVDRAGERLERRDAELALLMDEVRDARTEAERARSRAEERLEEAANTEREWTAKSVELDRRGEQLEKEAQRSLEERMRGARRALERAESLLPQLTGTLRTDLKSALEAMAAEVQGASLTDRRKAFLDALKKGDLVHLPRYRQRCQVKRVDRDKREVTVLLGGMKLKVPFDEVTWYESL